MKKEKFYCDHCGNEKHPDNFLHIEIKVSRGYGKDCDTVLGVGGKEDLNFCIQCAESLGFENHVSGPAWCRGVRKMFATLKGFLLPEQAKE